MNVIAKRVSKFVGYTAAGLFGLFALFYLLLLFINRNDQPPSDLVLELRERSASYANDYTPEDNAHTLLIGFAAAPEDDPTTLGKARLKWLETTEAFSSFDGDPGWPMHDLKAGRPKDVSQLIDACAKRDPINCSLTSHALTVANWIKKEGWLLDRYRELISLQFSEPRTRMIEVISPPLPHFYEAQRLFAFDIWRTAVETDNYAAAIAALDAELDFWRKVLAAASTPWMKSLAAGAIRNHLWLNQRLLQELATQGRILEPPAGWAIGFSDAERSFQRPLEGQWRSVDEPLAVADSQSLLDRVFLSLFGPLLKQQDLSNRRAERIHYYADAFAVPLDALPASLAEVREVIDGSDLNATFYNPLGEATLALFFDYQYLDYAAEIADLEGIRRMTLLAAELRTAGVDPADMEVALGEAELKDPYTNEPFEWDAEAGAIIFRGLERTRLGYHAIAY